MAKRPKLVTQFLERIHRNALEKHPDLVRDFVHKRNGVYVLLKGDEIYYAGLASNLRSRLKHHLKDRHREHWDRLSVYLTIGGDHLRELESLLIRVARPPGNRQKGRFSGAENLERKFERALDRKHQSEKLSLFGWNDDSLKEAGESRRSQSLRGRHQSRVVKARMRPDGTVRYAGTLYSSLSAAARKVCGHAKNGRWFWRVERSPGDWVRISKMGRSKKRV